MGLNVRRVHPEVIEHPDFDSGKMEFKPLINFRSNQSEEVTSGMELIDRGITTFMKDNKTPKPCNVSRVSLIGAFKQEHRNGLIPSIYPKIPHAIECGVTELDYSPCLKSKKLETSKELWDTLEAKYMAEDASSKKFLVRSGICLINLQVYYVTYVSEAYFVADDDVLCVGLTPCNCALFVKLDAGQDYSRLNDGSILYMENESTALVHGHGCVDLRFSSGKVVPLLNVLHVPNIRENLVIK
ncbi:hypothetical protein Tco_0930067 [Tanacetum coccineum]